MMKVCALPNSSFCILNSDFSSCVPLIVGMGKAAELARKPSRTKRRGVMGDNICRAARRKPVRCGMRWSYRSQVLFSPSFGPFG